MSAGLEGDTGIDPDLKDGYDIRDLLTESGNATDRMAVLQELISDRVVPVPSEWPGMAQDGSGDPEGESNRPKIQIEPCESWEELLGYCGKP